MYQNQYQQGGYAPQGNANYGTNGSYGANGQNAGTNGTGNVYVGSAKFQQGQYGLMVSVSLNAEDIAKLQASLNENGWVTFSLRERQQPSQSGATHYGVIRPPMPPQQGNANWNGGNGGYGGNGGRGNYGQGQYQQNYRQAPPPNQGYRQAPAPQGYRTAPQNYPPAAPQYDNGGFNQPQQPAPQNYPPASAPAPQPEQHRYTQADAQPPAADAQPQNDDLVNGMPM